MVQIRQHTNEENSVLFALLPYIKVRISTMELLIEVRSAEATKQDRDRHKRMLLGLDRTSQVTAFLAETADAVLDGQFKAEDQVILLKQVVLPDTATQASKTALQESLDAARTQAKELAALFSKLLMAARYDCTAVMTAMSTDEDLAGLTAAQIKAIKTNYSGRKQEGRFRGRQDRRPEQRQSDILADATRNLLVLQAAGASKPQLPTPVPASQDGRYRYACKACGVKGHWKNEGLCKPEDLQANIAKIVAMLPARLALPAPSGSSASGSSPGRNSNVSKIRRLADIFSISRWV